MIDVHPTAQVDSTAQLHPGAVVGAHSVVGPDCVIHRYGIVGPHTTLGARCEVHPFAVIGGPAQDRRTAPEAPFTLVCGPENIFREGVTVSRGTAHGGGETRLGAENLLMAHSHVGHDAQLGDQNTLANGVSVAGHVCIGDRVNLGGHAGVHQFVRIGDLAFIAANAMVSGDVPPFTLVSGDRARIVGLNVTGLKRAGLSQPVRSALSGALKRFYAPGPQREVASLHLSDPTPEVAHMAHFVVHSERRGIRRGR
ncbi:MAG: acyl-ACP--UDP-N-acetylglucosamine O-acyltransferase [Bradymonadia bacterium]